MKRVLIANRGEIALRIIRACHDEGLEAFLVCSEADRNSLPARSADRAVQIGASPASASYLDMDRVIGAAKLLDCDAVHPGYGFLSESAAFADACAENGLVFVGPSADTLRRGGDKVAAKELAAKVGVPTGRSTPALPTEDQAVAAAAELGYPVMLKASAGGGGRGMTILRAEDDVRRSYSISSEEARQAFGDGRVYLERFVERARHVEVQILGDRHGHVIHLGDRDCSSQRRYQKIVEEAPAPGLESGLRSRLHDAAVALATELDYVGAGTFEFLVDEERPGEYYFLEMNGRVQVEHPVTEQVTGVDIVRATLRVAAGEPLGIAQEDVRVTGHAIECRITAEDPALDFAPRPGTITEWTPPVASYVRLDSHAENGYTVPPYYDSMVAKLIVSGADRTAALEHSLDALRRFHVAGIPTNIGFLLEYLQYDDFRNATTTTRSVPDFLAAVAAPSSDADPTEGSA